MEYKAYIVKKDDGSVYTVFSDKQPDGALSEKDSKKFIEEQKAEEDNQKKKDQDAAMRIEYLQDKAVLEGLTDEEKAEYKKLKGGE